MLILCNRASVNVSIMRNWWTNHFCYLKNAAKHAGDLLDLAFTRRRLYRRLWRMLHQGEWSIKRRLFPICFAPLSVTATWLQNSYRRSARTVLLMKASFSVRFGRERRWSGCYIQALFAEVSAPSKAEVHHHHRHMTNPSLRSMSILT